MSGFVGISRRKLLGHRTLKDFEKHQALGFAPPWTPCGHDEKVLRDRILETLLRRDHGELVAASRRDRVALVIAGAAEFGCKAPRASGPGISAEWVRRALVTFARADVSWNRRERGRWWSGLPAELHAQVTDTTNQRHRGPKLGSRANVACVRRFAEDWCPFSPADVARFAFPLAALLEISERDEVEHGAIIEVLPAVGIGLSAMAHAALAKPWSAGATALALTGVLSGAALADEIEIELPSIPHDRASIGYYVAEYVTERYLRGRGCLDASFVRVLLPIVVYMALPSDPGWLRAMAPAQSFYLADVPSAR
jgi:hypothetical protein